MNTNPDRPTDRRSDTAVDPSGSPGADLPATFPAGCDLSIGHNTVPIGSSIPGLPPERIVCLFCDAVRRVRDGDLDGPEFDGIPYPEYVDHGPEGR